MPFIRVNLFEGHPQEQKERIAKRITEVFQEEAPTVPKELIWVAFSEDPATNWTIGGETCQGIPE